MVHGLKFKYTIKNKYKSTARSFTSFDRFKKFWVFLFFVVFVRTKIIEGNVQMVNS